MNHLELFHTTSYKCSRIITEHYSTSFSLGIRTLQKKFHFPIYGIYGFVRYADEIVDTFHDFDKKSLLTKFKEDTYKAINEGISLNPVLHSFQMVVNEYNIEMDLINAFLHSMEMDLYQQEYTNEGYEEYIYGSAEVVGLMCLRVFCEGNDAMFQKLKASARSLGAAFQKVNFLRDIQSDYEERGRTYFPGVNFDDFTLQDKIDIENDIQKDFDDAYRGILQLPREARLGVYLAYIYYVNLFKRIRNTPASQIFSQRIRVPDLEKMALLFKTWFLHRVRYL